MVNYYFAASGSGGNSGSIDSPFRGSSEFNSNVGVNDTAYFRRGDTFGTSSNPYTLQASGITIKAYGVGDAPIITALSSIDSWSNVSGNVWDSDTFSYNPSSVYFSNVLGNQVSWSPSALYEWGYFSSKIRVYSPNGNSPAVEYNMGVIEDISIIELNSCDNIIIEQLKFKKWGFKPGDDPNDSLSSYINHLSVNAAIRIPNNSTSNLIIRNCIFDGYREHPGEVYPNILNPSILSLNGNVSIYNCDFLRAFSGIYIISTTGNHTVDVYNSKFLACQFGITSLRSGGTIILNHGHNAYCGLVLPNLSDYNKFIGANVVENDLGNNIYDEDLKLTNINRYADNPPAAVSLDAIGLATMTESFVDNIINGLIAAKIFQRPSLAVNSNSAFKEVIERKVADWYDLGCEINNHGRSKTIYALSGVPVAGIGASSLGSIKYIGLDSSATLTASNGILSIEVPIATQDIVNIDITTSSIEDIESYFANKNYTFVRGTGVLTGCAASAINVSGLDIKTSAKDLVFDFDMFVSAEYGSSKHIIENLLGVTGPGGKARTDTGGFSVDWPAYENATNRNRIWALVSSLGMTGGRTAYKHDPYTYLSRTTSTYPGAGGLSATPGPRTFSSGFSPFQIITEVMTQETDTYADIKKRVVDSYYYGRITGRPMTFTIHPRYSSGGAYLEYKESQVVDLYKILREFNIAGTFGDILDYMATLTDVNGRKYQEEEQEIDTSLTTASICRNVGYYISSVGVEDILGNPRKSGKYIDIGAYEYVDVPYSSSFTESWGNTDFSFQKEIASDIPIEGIKVFTPVNDKNKIYGMSLPFMDLEKPFFSKVSGKKLLENNIAQILMTEKGERVMLPDFGCNLRKYIFAQLDETTFISIKNEILTSIKRYAPNLRILKLGVFPLDNYGYSGYQALSIKLLLAVNDSNETFEIELEV